MLILASELNPMSDAEFDLLDELYFVQSFVYLSETLQWKEEELIDTLDSLSREGMIKCLTTPDQECFDQVDLQQEARRLFFLATKKGLMAHNAR